MRSDFRALLSAAVFLCAANNAALAQTLPAPWTSADVGAPTLRGSASAASGTFTVDGSGADIWGTADQFHFVYRPITGNGEIIARVASIGNSDPWAKAGVMFREALTGASRHAMMATTPANGAWFGRRPDPGALSLSTKDPAGTPPAWVRLVRTGDLFEAYRSVNGTTWTRLGSETILMGATVYVGLAVTSHNNTLLTRAVLDNVQVIGGSGNQSPAVTLTSPAAGSQYTAPATVSLAATATDPENRMTAVDFYVEGNMVGSDTSAPYTASWSATTPGTYSLSAFARDADGGSSWSSPVSVTVQAPANSPPTVSLTSPASGASYTAPATINLAANAADANGTVARVEFFSGATLLNTDTTSPYAYTWSNVAAGSYSLRAVAYDNAGASASSATVTVTVSAATGLPDGQVAADIGSPAIAGSTTFSSGAYTVRASGSDVWGTADQFHFAYRQVTGNTQIVVHVASLGNTDPWAKAGIMIRETLTAGSRHAMMAATPANGTWFGRRLQPDTASVSSKDTTGTSSAWLRLVRTSNLIEGFWSTDGVNWIRVGSETISMAATVYVGMAATSHNTSTATTVVYDNLAVTTPTGNQPPTATLTSPASGATFTAPATINMTANATDPEGQVARVEFFSGTTLLGTDTTAPYAFTWSNVAAGSYSLRAVAYDAAGASANSATATVTVSSVSSAPTGIVFTASADHSTNVTNYVLKVFPQGANPDTATPTATSDLGKPTPDANNDITVDRASFFAALAAGNYIATVTAIGPGGQTRSTTVSFVR